MDVSRLALSQPLPRLLVEVYGFIAVCSAVTLLHPALRRPEKRAVRQAVNSWWPPALLGGAAVILGATAAVLLLSVMANDASQYLCGKLFGRTALAPVISPRKTWEGFAGGVAVTSAVTAAAAPAITGLGRAEAALVGALLASLGLLGDLLVSALKRDVGVKDTGAVLPGQGGVLDRMDSLLLAAPAFFFYAQARCP